MKIALGTTSEAKRRYLEEVINEIGLQCEIESIDVKSGISEQPISSQETKRGSINRAKKALKEVNDADCGLGIEVGYHPDKNKDFEMLCWASIVDSRGKLVSSQSHKIKLPEFHQQILREEKYLSDYVRQFIKENPDPISQYIGIIIRDRKPFIQTAVRSALMYYFQQ